MNRREIIAGAAAVPVIGAASALAGEITPVRRLFEE